MSVFYPIQGECGFTGQWGAVTALTTARGFDAALLTIPVTAPLTQPTHYMRYGTGSTAQLVPGETITGGTSSATATVVTTVIDDGTIGGTNQVGIIFIQRLSGTPAAAGETWTGSKSTGTIVTIQAPMMLKSFQVPIAALITVETAGITFTLDRTTPTVSGGTNNGHQMTSGQSYVIVGLNNIQNFRCINTTASNGCVVKWSLFYN